MRSCKGVASVYIDVNLFVFKKTCTEIQNFKSKINKNPLNSFKGFIPQNVKQTLMRWRREDSSMCPWKDEIKIKY